MSRLLLALALVVSSLSPALAQRDAGAKARGDFFFYASSGYSHVNAAHAHASHYHGYLGSTPAISPRVAQLSDSTMNHHLDMTQQHLAGMREYFEKTDDDDSIVVLDEIDKHLAEADRHRVAAQEAARTAPDKPLAVQENVGKMQDSLDKVMAGQETLIKKHGIEKPSLRPAADTGE
jgi:type I site-specific restriction-modification system R (restriction) subunit